MLKVADVAKRLNCSIATVYQLVESKRLPHYRCPAIRVSEEQLTEYLTSCFVNGKSHSVSPKLPRQRLKHIRI